MHVNRLMRIVLGTLYCYRIRYSTNKRCIKECVIAVLCYYQIVCALLFWVIQCMLTVHKHHMLFFPNVFSPKKWFHCFMSMVRCTAFVVYGIPTWYTCSATTYVNCALFCLHIYVFSERCYIQWPHYFAVLRYLTVPTYITQWMLRWI